MGFFRFSILMLIAAAVAAQQAPPQASPPADVATIPADAAKTHSGLATIVLKPGTGVEHPGKDEVVVIDLIGRTADGKVFDDTVARGKPATMSVNRTLPGFAEGLQLMVIGETRRMWVPESLAFKGQKGKPAGTVVFDVTLLAMPTQAPSDVKHPPDDAKETPSGLFYKVLQPGTGTRHPKRSDEVTVEYTGWTTDGKMFDTSVAKGMPSTLPMDRVISGWMEGLSLMVEGEKARFWIPEKLAYKGHNAPYGMLVFDIELIRIR
jgi:FKBP-type peptidyl-prolyl cis-trans isomerase